MDESGSDFVNHLGGSEGTIQQALDELKQKKSSVDQVRDEGRYQAPNNEQAHSIFVKVWNLQTPSVAASLSASKSIRRGQNTSKEQKL